MPLESYPQDDLQPASAHIEVWRFLPLQWFQKFLESGKLYFRRSDLFEDDQEGLPPEEYVRHVCESMGPGHSAEFSLEDLRKGRQGFFVSCWTEHESLEMWGKFAPGGIALRSRYGLLKDALNGVPERAMVGKVRYSTVPHRYNTLHFITTKRPDYNREREVRALLLIPESGGTNPFPYVQAQGLSYSVDVRALVQEIVVSPRALPGTLDDIQALVKRLGYSLSVTPSTLTSYAHLWPTVDEIVRYSRT